MKAYGLGIDLGTTISLASVVDSSGQPSVIRAASGKHLVPSAVFFDAGVDVGEIALKNGLRDPAGLAEAFKRDIGKPHYSREVRSTQVPPEVLTAYLLRYLMRNIEAEMGHIAPAVVTVPAYFDERKRTSTQQAAQLAGLEVLDIINEPTAAAIALGHGLMATEQENSSRPRRFLVYDLGGGTFDVTLLQYSNRVFKALGTDGDIYLGGRDFDEKIVHLIAEKFIERHGIDPRQKVTESQRLWKRAQEVKHKLSEHESVFVGYDYDGMVLEFDLDRAVFEEAVEPLIERSMFTAADVVRGAGLDWSEIDDFLLVGGSSRIPLVAKKVTEHFRLQPRLTPNPDELIAHGAALYAAAKSEGILDANSRFQVVNVNAHSLGVRGVDAATKQSINKVLIPRNSPLPATNIYSFVTSKDGQKSAKVPLLEGESENPEFCSLIGECVVRIDRPLPRGSNIKVICNYSANGTISVSAKIASTGESAHTEIRRDGYATLEPLSVWTARLTSGGFEEVTSVDLLHITPPGKERINRRDRDAILRRLDKLFRYIGQSAMQVTTPARAAQTHQLIERLSVETNTLKQLIQRLEQAHNKSSSIPDRMQLAGQTAQLKMAWEHSKGLLDHMLLVLGRECVAENMTDASVQPFVRESQELMALLEA